MHTCMYNLGPKPSLQLSRGCMDYITATLNKFSVVIHMHSTAC